MIRKMFIVLLLLANTNTLFAAIGCMDNSYHTKQKIDYKTYHYVQCNCPCHKYASSFVRGKCPKCGHYHDPGDFEVLTSADIRAEIEHEKHPSIRR